MIVETKSESRQGTAFNSEWMAVLKNIGQSKLIWEMEKSICSYNECFGERSAVYLLVTFKLGGSGSE